MLESLNNKNSVRRPDKCTIIVKGKRCATLFCVFFSSCRASLFCRGMPVTEPVGRAPVRIEVSSLYAATTTPATAPTAAAAAGTTSSCFPCRTFSS